MPPSPQATLGPPATPPAYSLVVAAETPNTQAQPAGWEIGGITWAPEQFAQGDAFCEDCGSGEHGAGPVNPVNQVAQPFVVAAEDFCSTFGFAARDFEGRARRQLEAVQSAKIAREFQLGELRDDCSLANVVLEDGTLVGAGGEHPVVDAFALMEEALAEEYGGRRAMIHVTPKVFTLARHEVLIELVGQKWQTGLGTIVVADAGYQTVAGHDWMYGTTLVRLLLSPVEIPLSWQEAARSNRVNDVQVFAQRMALVQYDSSEVADGDKVFKIEVDAPFGAGS